ncbi:2-hydroxychromene-2-carboxylate isomerase [Cupriavidus gilardii J11]|uniref:2-hydroxychromene-2-carboxylate isomerase n=1 Tax=Cupriavidus gilardii J11 TaxID=936133 RepID=A0A562BAK0_9BURK|nr:2-hydroxychromene-2-carboxylate isomerase [Cupriavidus gilardii]TWG82235.1 2-hydroxychromene-2-carboxylate isomerase [Cupriavidus gilardii J11]
MTAPTSNTDTIDFYFDFSSPYGYFASTRIEALAARHGRTVAWHPILLGVVFRITGMSPLPEVPLKGDYSWRDFERTARHHGIPYRRPSRFPLPTTHAARAMLWLREQSGEALAIRFAHATYAAFFVDDVDISDLEAVVAIAASLGVDRDAFIAGVTGADIKASLKREVDAAVERGVFGSPFMIADGEPFWGFDRFDQLEAHLQSGMPAASGMPRMEHKENQSA